MKNRVLVLQHGDWQNRENFLANLTGKFSIEMRTVGSFREKLPNCSDFDALIFPGYPPNANLYVGAHSFQLERQLLQDWLVLDKPFLGFGYGYQLLAEAFRAVVGPNFMSSTGFVEGYLTHDGREHPLFKGIQPNISLLKWYEQSMMTPVPQNCILLATSRECVVEAFTIKGRPHIVGIQGDNHAAHPDDVYRWMQSDPEWFQERFPGENSGKLLLDHAGNFFDANQKVFKKMISNFISFTRK